MFFEKSTASNFVNITHIDKNGSQWIDDYIGNLKFPIVTDRDFYLELLNNSEGCRSSVEDWIKFKAETADIPEYLKKVL